MGVSQAGFVLAGGASSRMGRGKALLAIGRSRLLEVVAARVSAVAGSVIVLPPERYAFLVCFQADSISDCGPLAGVYTALKTSPADWNPVVACDMPSVTVGFLSSLLDAAEEADAAVLVPKAADGSIRSVPYIIGELSLMFSL